MTLTTEQTARTIYYLKVARQRIATQLADPECVQSRQQIEYAELNDLILVFVNNLENQDNDRCK